MDAVDGPACVFFVASDEADVDGSTDTPLFSLSDMMEVFAG